MDENLVEKKAKYLTPPEVMEEAQDLRERYLRRQISDPIMTQMLAFRVENPDEAGRIPLREYGLHDLGAILQATARQPMWSNATVRKDVLDTTFSGGAGGGALARVDLEPVIYS